MEAVKIKKNQLWGFLGNNKLFRFKLWTNEIGGRKCKKNKKRLQFSFWCYYFKAFFDNYFQIGLLELRLSPFESFLLGSNVQFTYLCYCTSTYEDEASWLHLFSCELSTLIIGDQVPFFILLFTYGCKYFLLCKKIRKKN